MATSLVARLMLVILMVVSPSFGISGYTYPSGIINLLENDSLNITCVLNETSGGNSSSLHFYINQTMVDKQYVTLLNASAIRLFIPHVNVSSEIYYCKLTKDNNYMALSLNDVNVGFAPTNVTDFKCRSPNWQFLNCTFTKPFNPVNVRYELEFRVEQDPGSNKFTCELGHAFNKRFACVLNANSRGGIYRQTAETYYFTLISKNDFGQLDQHFEIDHYSMVVPDRPVNLTTSGSTPNSTKLSWRAPFQMQNFPKPIIYSISYLYVRDVWIELPPHVYKTQNKIIEYELKNLPYAYVAYDVRVRSRVLSADNIPEMWSQNGSLIFTSGKRIPDTPPKTAAGGFFVDDNHHVYVYWKELDKFAENGANFGYQLECNTHSIATIDKPSNSTRFRHKYQFFAANVNDDIEFTIRSKNEVGLSVNSSTIRVPRKASRCEPPGEIRNILHNKSTSDQRYVFSWRPPANSSHTITSYTVFWCNATNESPNACDSDFDFVELRSNETSFEKYTDRPLNFAVSANSNYSSSGMVWARCTAIADYDISKVTDTKTIAESKWAALEWNTACIDESLSKGYQITYCQVAAERNNTDCLDTLQTIEVNGAAIHNYTLSDLVPYRTYKVNIAAKSLTPSKLGPNSDSYYFTTLESSPSPPRSLMSVNVTSNATTLVWEAPLEINGVLNRYTVFYNGEKVEVPKQGNSTDRMTYVLTKLNAHTTYEIRVSACTGVLPCSMTSNNVTVKTDIGPPSTVFKVPDKFRRNNMYEWLPPAIAGGNLDYYEMAVINDDNKEDIIYLHSNCTIMNPIHCMSNETYQIKVRAVNVRYTPHGRQQEDDSAYPSSTPDPPHRQSGIRCLEEDPQIRQHIKLRDKHALHFAGEWYEIRQNLCARPSLIEWTVNTALLLGLFIVCFWLLWKFFWKKLEHMRSIDVEFPIAMKNKLADAASGNVGKSGGGSGGGGGGGALSNLDIGRINEIGRADKLFKQDIEQEVSLLQPDQSLSSHNSAEDESDSLREVDTIDASNAQRDIEKQRLEAMVINNDLSRQSPLVSLKQSPTHEHRFKFDADYASTTPVVMPVITNTIIPRPLARPMSTFSPNHIVVQDAPPIRSPTTVNANGYVPNDIVPYSGYIPQAVAFAVRSSVPTPAGTPDDLRAKLPVAALSDDRVISGYVTHKQLSDFGQMIQ